MTKEEANHLSGILKAWSEGRTIVEYKNGKFVDMESNDFSSRPFDYGIKPEHYPYRPYNDADEFLNAQKEHGPYLREGGQYLLPILIGNDYEDGIVIGNIHPNFCEYENLLKNYIWQDGTPCGIEN